MLLVTSHATTTSPVLRGKWVLENLLGAPPPPPPPDVPALEEDEPGAPRRTMREQMEQHRNKPACASCHKTMDPIGFALENFDVVGAWRTDERVRRRPRHGRRAGQRREESTAWSRLRQRPAEASRRVRPDADGKAAGLCARPRPDRIRTCRSVRKIVRDAREPGLSIFGARSGIVNSVPFQMRLKPPTGTAQVAAAVVAFSWRSLMFITKMSPAAADLPARRGRDAGAAAARRDGAGGHRAGEDAGRRAVARGLHLHAARRGHGGVDAERGPAARFELSPTLQAAGRSRQRLARRRQQPQAGRRSGRDARGGGVGLAERRHPQADRGRRLPGRHDHRSGDREADRTGVAVPVARVRDRGLHRLCRRLHAGLQLRLHEHDLVGVADDAAADGDQSAHGVRAAVRRRRVGRRAAPAGAGRPRASSIRSSARRESLQSQLGVRDRARVADYLATSAKSSAGFSRPKRSTARSSRSSTSRSAFPSRSTSTRR